MSNLLRLFDEAYPEGSGQALESAIQGNQITIDLQNIIDNFKRIKAGLEKKEPHNFVLINKVNEGLANAENLLHSMRDSLSSLQQNAISINRP